MRLEQFQNTLIPVDMVLWAIYDNGKTSVVIKVPDAGFTRSIDFEGDCLKKFLKWHRKMSKKDDQIQFVYPPNVLPQCNATIVELTDEEPSKSDSNVTRCVSHPL